MFIREEEDKGNSEDTSKDTGNTETESEDTSESDTGNEEDTSEDTESEDSESEDDSGDSEEDTISKQYFADPNSIPKELRAPFKKMQGIFTRKMQEASISVKKAEAFDQLVTDPEFRTWMEDRANTLKGITKKKSENSKGNEGDSDEENKPLTRKEFQAMMQQQKAQEQVKIEYAEFIKKNPDHLLYQDSMRKLLDNSPTLTYQQAYDLASMDDHRTSKKKDDMESKKRANTMKPKGVTKEPDKKKGKMTFQEAFDMAKKSVGLGKKG